MKKTSVLMVVLLTSFIWACGDQNSAGTKPEQTVLGEPSQTNDWRMLIDDPDMLREIHDFSHECYAEAQKRVTGQINKPQWIGAPFFLETHGYYDTIIVNRALGNSREATCKEWWADSEKGLHARLLKKVKNPELLTSIGYWDEPLPKLKTVADFQQFIENGVLCKNMWYEEMVANHEVDSRRLKVLQNDIKALEEMVRNAGLETNMKAPENDDIGFNLAPKNKKMSIFSFDLSYVLVTRSNGSTIFLAALNADPREVSAKLAGLVPTSGRKRDDAADVGYRLVPSDETEKHTLPASHHAETIEVGSNCEPEGTCAAVSCFFSAGDEGD